MKKSIKIALIALPITLGLGLGAYLYYNYNISKTKGNKAKQTEGNFPLQGNVKIASWNLQIFGEKKANNPELMQSYANILTNYNIIFIEEIRDSTGKAFPALCSLMKDYDSLISSRAGRTKSKEQYGVIFRKNQANVKEFKDYNPDTEDRWERPPIEVVFNMGSEYTIRVFAIHTDPDDAKNEISALERITTNSGNVIVIGDLNASGTYYNNRKRNDFADWTWVIKDGEDTTVSTNNSHTYERNIVTWHLH